MLEFLHAITDSIDGWLFYEEVELLYSLAKACPKESCIVEIGSYHGKSTCCLALGSLKGNNVPIYAVDPHSGSPEILSLLNLDSIDTREVFQSNLKRVGLALMVVPIFQQSAAAAKSFSEQIGLLFIDGRHEYEYVCEDAELWIPKVIENGVIAFHDCTEGSGPQKVVAELLKTGTVSQAQRVRSTEVLSKCAF